jgi:hypothetical protein
MTALIFQNDNLYKIIDCTLRSQVLCKCTLKTLVLQSFSETICTKPGSARYKSLQSSVFLAFSVNKTPNAPKN